ncbi:MAG: hypothetical protein AAF658_19325, partial [Myxococcota bacterium]
GFLIEALESRRRWVLERAWESAPLGVTDFQALMAKTPSSFRATPAGLPIPVASLVVWTVIAWLLAGLSLRSRSLDAL